MATSCSKKIVIAVLLAAVLMMPSKACADDFEYRVSWSLDVPLVLGAGLASLFGNHLLSQMDVSLGMLPKEDLLPWDRPLAGRYNSGADLASDWAAVLAAAPLVLGGVSYGRGDAPGREVGAYALMFLEAVGFQNGINLFVRSFEFWPRPYMYAESGSGLKLKEKAKGEAYGSFYSGHTSAAFTVAVFTSEWFQHIYPNSPYKNLVWATSLSAAGLVGVLRVAAGKHYYTDILVGALAGTGISLGILELHRRPSSPVSLWAGPGNMGLSYRF